MGPGFSPWRRGLLPRIPWNNVPFECVLQSISQYPMCFSSSDTPAPASPSACSTRPSAHQTSVWRAKLTKWIVNSNVLFGLKVRSDTKPSPPVGCRPIGGLGFSPPSSASRRSAPIPRPQARVICADFQPATFVFFRDPARSRTFSPQTDWAWYRRGPSARTACPSARTFELAIQTAFYGRQTKVYCPNMGPNHLSKLPQQRHTFEFQEFQNKQQLNFHREIPKTNKNLKLHNP